MVGCLPSAGKRNKSMERPHCQHGLGTREADIRLGSWWKRQECVRRRFES